MDGLLVDSERMERRVWLAAAEDHGVDLTDERFLTFVGLSADQCNRLLGEYYGDGFDVEAFRASCHRYMRALVRAEGVPLRPGAREWLRFLSECDLPIGLATSSAPGYVPERLGELVDLFSAVVTRAEVERGKPYPDLYLEAAVRLGAEPSSCLAVEDSPVGARAALAAGMPVVVVPDLLPPPAELTADLVGVYASLEELRMSAALSWSGSREPVRPAWQRPG